ncbi:uncharacterized protein LOC121379726 [Gigantopelta aegis]|uniref:uncharacterized protein LOC121379726 n=1 Tax=Gigantopelta aegis TaxID=1735272 RepID=UPI001B887511|nr:uncharacterized protein LOC121379726 [Gigantopelta aegis]
MLCFILDRLFTCEGRALFDFSPTGTSVKQREELSLGSVCISRSRNITCFQESITGCIVDINNEITINNCFFGSEDINRNMIPTGAMVMKVDLTDVSIEDGQPFEDSPPLDKLSDRFFNNEGRALFDFSPTGTSVKQQEDKTVASCVRGVSERNCLTLTTLVASGSDNLKNQEI